uniref:Uncharacterized protein LOC114345945 n=1 Tax=Diabrotica virgifera virgifera TaxID=50390 RepID=A0A6P7H269_DIAVI
MKHKFYSNKHARNEALIKILGEVNKVNGDIQFEDVKKIANLRQQFAHENAKLQAYQKSGTGSEEVVESSLWFFEKLLFLIPHIKTRKTKSTLDVQIDDFLENEIIETNSEAEESLSMVSTPTSKPATSKVTSDPISKKRIKVESSPDPVISEAVSTLKSLQNKIVQPKTCSVGKHQSFADYLANEMKSIGDEELIADLKHDINNLLYKTKKWLQMEKENHETIVVEVNNFE